MPTTDGPNPSTGGSSVRVVEYIATGAEGVSFMVPIGTELADASYSVLWAPQGVSNVPLLDLPQGVGDRTTTEFRVMTAVQLGAGEKLHFWITEV